MNYLQELYVGFLIFWLAGPIGAGGKSPVDVYAVEVVVLEKLVQVLREIAASDGIPRNVRESFSALVPTSQRDHRLYKQEFAFDAGKFLVLS